MMALEITTLEENTEGEHTGMIAEHGLSFLVEMNSISVLFDTGRSSAFLQNAQKLNKPLDAVEHIVLSHGHYDHSGGFRPLVETYPNHPYTLYTGDGFFNPKYARFNASYQYLGNDFNTLYLRQHGIKHEIIKEKKEILPGIWMVSNFFNLHPEETIHPRFVVRTSNGWMPDHFSDEVLLVVESSKGLIVLVGCSHPGILNMLDTVRQQFSSPIYALLGGTHLVESDMSRTKTTIEEFKRQGISILGISHCSGNDAIVLATENSEMHFHNTLGSSLILEE